MWRECLWKLYRDIWYIKLYIKIWAGMCYLTILIKLCNIKIFWVYFSRGLNVKWLQFGLVRDTYRIRLLPDLKQLTLVPHISMYLHRKFIHYQAKTQATVFLTAMVYGLKKFTYSYQIRHFHWKSNQNILSNMINSLMLWMLCM